MYKCVYMDMGIYMDMVIYIYGYGYIYIYISDTKFSIYIIHIFKISTNSPDISTNKSPGLEDHGLRCHQGAAGPGGLPWFFWDFLGGFRADLWWNCWWILYDYDVMWIYSDILHFWEDFGRVDCENDFGWVLEVRGQAQIIWNMRPFRSGGFYCSTSLLSPSNFWGSPKNY